MNADKMVLSPTEDGNASIHLFTIEGTVNSSIRNMVLKNWKGNRVRQQDLTIAKN